MKIRLFLAALLACLSFQAFAQYGYPPMYPPPMQQARVYQGLWWNPAEAGWGLNTTHQGSILFATLFIYDSDGQPLWLVASNLSDMGDYVYSGPLYRTDGPPFNQVPWTPIGYEQVGTMTISYDSADSGFLTYSVNGSTVNKTFVRMVFANPVPTCTLVSNTAGARASSTNYQDLWWNADESGWGINLVHQGDIIFATLFTYGDTRRDKWFLASGMTRQADGSYAGGFYSTTGTAFTGMAWMGYQIGQVGNVSLRFSDGEHAVLQYNVGMTTVTKDITRLVYGSTVPLCHE